MARAIWSILQGEWHFPNLLLSSRALLSISATVSFNGAHPSQVTRGRARSPRDWMSVSWYDLPLVPFSCTDVGSIKSLSFYRNKWKSQWSPESPLTSYDSLLLLKTKLENLKWIPKSPEEVRLSRSPEDLNLQHDPLVAKRGEVLVTLWNCSISQQQLWDFNVT